MHSQEDPDDKPTIADICAVTRAEEVLKGTYTVWPTKRLRNDLSGDEKELQGSFLDKVLET